MYTYIIYIYIRKERETYCIDTYAFRIRTYVYIYILCIYKCVWLYIWFFLDVGKIHVSPRSDAFAAVLRRLVMPAIWTCPLQGSRSNPGFHSRHLWKLEVIRRFHQRNWGFHSKHGAFWNPNYDIHRLDYKRLLDLLWNLIWDGSVGFPDGHGSNMIKQRTWKPS